MNRANAEADAAVQLRLDHVGIDCNAAIAPAPVYAPTEVAPEVYVTPAPAYAPTYDAPLQAYGAARGVIMQRRVYLDEAPRPPAPVPYGRRGRASNAARITVTDPRGRACPSHPRLLDAGKMWVAAT